MSISRFLSLGFIVGCVAALSQCALYQNWRGEYVTSENADLSLALPAHDDGLSYQLPLHVSRMPTVALVDRQLLSEKTYSFGGRKYLEQRILLSETPLETELRVTQIP